MGTRLLFGAVGALCALITALVLNALFAALLPHNKTRLTCCFNMTRRLSDACVRQAPSSATRSSR